MSRDDSPGAISAPGHPAQQQRRVDGHRNGQQRGDISERINPSALSEPFGLHGQPPVDAEDPEEVEQVIAPAGEDHEGAAMWMGRSGWLSDGGDGEDDEK